MWCLTWRRPDYDNHFLFPPGPLALVSPAGRARAVERALPGQLRLGGVCLPRRAAGAPFDHARADRYLVECAGTDAAGYSGRPLRRLGGVSQLAPPGTVAQ